jgi:hypothetical protein
VIFTVRRVRTPALVLLLLVVCGAAVAVAVGGGGDEHPAAERRPPVVVVVLDEFSTEALTKPGGEIDAERYPNFAALAETSTWFRNGQSIFDSSFRAVPSILDGRMPRPLTTSDVRSHQPSIYHLMDRLGYDVIKVESATAVCPPRICEGARARRPGVISRLGGSGRPARLHRWIGAIRDRDRPTFYFHHTLLPHEPWIYLPSGRLSRPPGGHSVPLVNEPGGWHIPWLTDHNHLRHLLQVGYTDRELGRLMRRLRRTGLFDRALIVVLADHGYSFELNVKSRRQVTRHNIDEIAPVPFFVKAPGQTEGVVDDAVVRGVDVLPTIADLLNVSVPWRIDGHSAFSAMTRARDHVSMARRDFGHVVSVGLDEWVRRRAALRVWRARKFGTGERSERVFGDPWRSAYRIGPNRELLGDRAPAGAPPGGARFRLANPALFEDVDRRDPIVPTTVEGRLEGGASGAERDLAVAVNGRIRAVGRSFHLRGQRPEYFSLIVPESTLRRGHNDIELFEVLPGGELRSLARAG